MVSFDELQAELRAKADPERMEDNIYYTRCSGGFGFYEEPDRGRKRRSWNLQHDAMAEWTRAIIQAPNSPTDSELLLSFRAFLRKHNLNRKKPFQPEEPEPGTGLDNRPPTRPN